MNVKKLSFLGGLGATAVLLAGNLSSAFAEEAVKVDTPANNTHVEQVDVSAEQVSAQRIASIVVPYGDSRKDQLTDLKWDTVAKAASGRSGGIVFLYSDSKGLAPEDDKVLQELKTAAQHLIADPDITFSGILAVDSSNDVDKLKVWIAGHEYGDLTFGYNEGSEGIKGEHGGLADVVLTSTRYRWDIQQEARRRIAMEQISGTKTETKAPPEVY